MRVQYWVDDELIIGGLEQAYLKMQNKIQQGKNPKCVKFEFDENNIFKSKKEVTLKVIEEAS